MDREEKVSVEHCLVHDDYWKQDKNNNFCNYCGAKRPEPRELWEVLRDISDAEYKKGRRNETRAISC